MAKIFPLTLACGDYEIVRPLREGKVQADGIDLTILTKHGFGDAPLALSAQRRIRRGRSLELVLPRGTRQWPRLSRALPVFLHRRFRHGFIFINTTKGISKPTDLIGRKVGVKTLMTSAVLWMRGILEHEYGVPLKSIEWFSELDDDIDVSLPADLRLTRLPHAKSVETMLAEGELDAVLHSDLIKPFLAKDPRVARLFPSYKDEEIAYYRKTGIFPIMHVLGLRQAVVEQYPWVAVNLFNAFNEAKAIAMQRMQNPRIVPLAWYREAWEEQESILGPDPWEYGLTDKNRKTLETLIGYSHEQGLIRQKPTLEQLFLDVSQGRKRGAEFRI